jgi:predicted RNA-binding Zn-ribbon protein involved in translation (DUF1610 family)
MTNKEAETTLKKRMPHAWNMFTRREKENLIEAYIDEKAPELKYYCLLCGRKFAEREGIVPLCPNCGEEYRAYVGRERRKEELDN